MQSNFTLLSIICRVSFEGGGEGGQLFPSGLWLPPPPPRYAILHVGIHTSATMYSIATLSSFVVYVACLQLLSVPLSSSIQSFVILLNSYLCLDHVTKSFMIIRCVLQLFVLSTANLDEDYQRMLETVACD